MNPTTVPGIETFPPWVQMVLTICGFLAAVLLYGRSLLKPTNTEKAAKDVIVPNINVMDGETLKDAANQIRQSLRAQETRDQQIRELHRELREQSDVMRECRNLLQSLNDHAENIDRRLRIELKRQAEADGRF